MGMDPIWHRFKMVSTLGVLALKYLIYVYEHCLEMILGRVVLPWYVIYNIVLLQVPSTYVTKHSTVNFDYLKISQGHLNKVPIAET